jgi:hypothetical protein
MTRRMRKTAVALAVAGLAGGLGGCAQTSKLLSFLHIGRSEQPKLAIRPVETPVDTSQIVPEDRVYNQAKAAIEARDYATALELLQIARQRAPNDGRLLNAMGVVYDKLGRFDLSRRYYEQALALQPNSPTVLANLEYSSKLQAYSTLLQEEARVATTATPSPKSVPTPSPTPAPAFRLAEAPAGAVSIVEPAILGSPIRLVDASGRASLAGGVRRHLVANGWSVDAAASRQVAANVTLIVYKVQDLRVAEALAHTLPFRTSLQACDSGCSGISLVVGANARLRGRG